MSKEQKNSFIEWILTNICLPLVPLGLKILICLFSNIKINIFDSIELILYSFFICIVLTSMTSDKETFGKLLHTFLIVLLFVDAIIMVLIYMNIGNIACKIYAFVMAITMPVFAISYKYSQTKKGKGGRK